MSKAKPVACTPASAAAPGSRGVSVAARLLVVGRSCDRQRALFAAQLVHLRGEIRQQARRARTKSDIRARVLAETRRDSLELRIDREVSAATGPHGDEHATRDGGLELSGVDEAATRCGRVKDELGARQVVVKLGEPFEPGRVAPEEMHDPERGENAPVVRLRVVSERGEPLPGRSMDGRRGIEVEARVVDAGVADDRVDRIVVLRPVYARTTLARLPIPMWYETTARSSRPKTFFASVK